METKMNDENETEDENQDKNENRDKDNEGEENWWHLTLCEEGVRSTL